MGGVVEGAVEDELVALEADAALVVVELVADRQGGAGEDHRHGLGEEGVVEQLGDVEGGDVQGDQRARAAVLALDPVDAVGGAHVEEGVDLLLEAAAAVELGGELELVVLVLLELVVLGELALDGGEADGDVVLDEEGLVDAFLGVGDAGELETDLVEEGLDALGAVADELAEGEGCLALAEEEAAAALVVEEPAEDAVDGVLVDAGAEVGGGAVLELVGLVDDHAAVGGEDAALEVGLLFHLEVGEEKGVVGDQGRRPSPSPCGRASRSSRGRSRTWGRGSCPARSRRRTRRAGRARS